MNKIKAYKVKSTHTIWIQFEDGFESVIDLSSYLGKGISKDLLKESEFRKVFIEPGGGLAWENGFDICPNHLRELAEKKKYVS